MDDLLLSGPAGAHEKFWKELGAKVNLEPAEDLDRYLDDTIPFSHLIALATISLITSLHQLKYDKSR